MKTSVVEIKGSLLTVLVLQVSDSDQGKVFAKVKEKVASGGTLFDRAPVVIDLNPLAVEQQRDFNLVRLAQQLRELGVVPVAARGVMPGLEEQVVQAGIGLLGESRQPKPDAGEEGQTSRQAGSGDRNEYRTKVIAQPVRSGQQIFAPGDLVVLSSVNAGAEVLARGNIHVYGALRGRALAGIDGDESARIFSMQCNPELIAVAGDYMVNESLDSTVVNQSVIISRDADGLVFGPLRTGQAPR